MSAVLDERLARGRRSRKWHEAIAAFDGVSQYGVDELQSFGRWDSTGQRRRMKGPRGVVICQNCAPLIPPADARNVSAQRPQIGRVLDQDAKFIGHGVIALLREQVASCSETRCRALSAQHNSRGRSRFVPDYGLYGFHKP